MCNIICIALQETRVGRADKSPKHSVYLVHMQPVQVATLPVTESLEVCVLNKLF